MEAHEPLSDGAIEARRKYLREYMRNYRKQHPDKYAEYNRRYWEKRAMNETDVRKTGAIKRSDNTAKTEVEKKRKWISPEYLVSNHAVFDAITNAVAGDLKTRRDREMYNKIIHAVDCVLPAELEITNGVNGARIEIYQD